MTTKHAPATPLPWESTRVSDPSGQNWISYEIGQARNIVSLAVARTNGWNESPSGIDAAYIAHAANAYPRLVERTERAAMLVFNPAQFPDASAETIAAIKRGWDAAMNTVWERNSALLRELGEA